MLPSKIELKICDRCNLPISSRCIEVRDTTEEQIIEYQFCSHECCHEALYGEQCEDDKLDAVEEERKFFIKSLCPSCLKRVT